jgi:DNA-binding NtrC family response regulator
LLRAVEERKFQRVESSKQIDLRARLLCATNRDRARRCAWEGRGHLSEPLSTPKTPISFASLSTWRRESALRACGDNRDRAAALLGMTRSTLYNKLKEYGIR